MRSIFCGRIFDLDIGQICELRAHKSLKWEIMQENVMLILNFLSKSMKYTPLVTPKRGKVKIFPKKFELEVEYEFRKKLPPQKRQVVDILAFIHRKSYSVALAELLTRRDYKNMVDDQRYMPERHKALGPDLACTHFLTIRGGKVKFTNNDNWMTYDDIQAKKIPSFYVPGFFVEEINASGMNLCYEGFDNLCGLTKLKSLNLSNCQRIDDWCLNRSHLFASTLEHLDISGCHLVTERGICTLHTLKKLKTLVINDTPNIRNKELVSLLLQEVIPKCEITGVDYDDPVLRKRIENFMS